MFLFGLNKLGWIILLFSKCCYAFPAYVSCRMDSFLLEELLAVETSLVLKGEEVCGMSLKTH